MKEIFLSYASDDRERARPLVEGLEASGRTVWWDRRLAIGKNYDEEIQEQLEASQCVVVLWSRTSVRSRWVKAEAQDAAEQGRLLPVFLDRVKAPLEYRYLNGVDLSRWDGSSQDPEFRRLLESLPPKSARSPADEEAPADEEDPVAIPVNPTEARAIKPPQAVGQDRPMPSQAGSLDRHRGPGEITAVRQIAEELTQMLDRVAGKERRSDKGPSSPDRKPGEVTVARAVSKRLAQALASFADNRGRVLPSTLALRYLGWSMAVPTALLLALHAVAHLSRLAS